MISPLEITTKSEIIYPDSDGKPMADNTVQFRWIMVLYHNLSWLFAEQNDVFVAGDLLWYPVEKNNEIRQAPDIMVVFGATKGDRGSYQQWKNNNIPPQVVFEILSPGNTLTEMARKWAFYERHEVEEYYLYDPQKNDLSGWYRQESNLEVIEEMNGWVSPRLQISFELTEKTLILYRPNGEPFADYLQVENQLEATKQELNQTVQRAEMAENRAEMAENRAEMAEKELANERKKLQKLEQLLRESGIELN
jgi:Uma2 family endonuclease